METKQKERRLPEHSDKRDTARISSEISIVELAAIVLPLLVFLSIDSF